MLTGTPSASTFAMFPPVRETLSFLVRRKPAVGAIPRTAVAFTLLELLAVIAIVGILTAIVIGVGRHAAEASKIARAKAEIAALATALESYKSQYGDYPQISADANIDSYNSSQELYRALSGLRGPVSAAIFSTQQRILFERTRFSMADLRAPDSSENNHFVDPWNNPYRYAYAPKSSAWKSSSYLFFCSGPDGMIQFPIPADGLITSAYETAASNADNIYTNRN